MGKRVPFSFFSELRIRWCNVTYDFNVKFIKTTSILKISLTQQTSAFGHCLFKNHQTWNPYWKKIKALSLHCYLLSLLWRTRKQTDAILKLSWLLFLLIAIFNCCHYPEIRKDHSLKNCSLENWVRLDILSNEYRMAKTVFNNFYEDYLKIIILRLCQSTSDLTSHLLCNIIRC